MMMTDGIQTTMKAKIQVCAGEPLTADIPAPAGISWCAEQTGAAVMSSGGGSDDHC